jgi:hypothetical protein
MESYYPRLTVGEIIPISMQIGGKEVNPINPCLIFRPQRRITRTRPDFDHLDLGGWEPMEQRRLRTKMHPCGRLCPI